MKLNYLETKDIGILSGIKRFDFHDQLTIIYGPNFSGKTTLAIIGSGGQGHVNRGNPHWRVRFITHYAESCLCRV